jgi:hypothetical protein
MMDRIDALGLRGRMVMAGVKVAFEEAEMLLARAKAALRAGDIAEAHRLYADCVVCADLMRDGLTGVLGRSL